MVRHSSDLMLSTMEFEISTDIVDGRERYTTLPQQNDILRTQQEI